MQNKSRLPLILILALIFIAGISIPVLGSKVYRVQPGDTAYQIARWHGVSLQNLLASNQLASAGYIIPRQVLFIPDPPTLADEDLYTVQAGDQLFSIAQKFQTSLNWLRQRNALSSDSLYIGQWLKVPASSRSSYVWNIPDLMSTHPEKVFLHGTTSRKQVALTFDDGPDTEYTPQILDILGQMGVKATFFLKGVNIPGREWVVTRMIREGHLVANHSYSHQNLRKLSPKQISIEVQKTEALVEKITGRKTALLRPPYGEMSAEGLNSLVAAGYSMVNWSVDSGDWQANHSDQVLQTILSQAKAGSIILMHSAGGVGQDLTPSVEALEELIITLWNLGYEIVPLTSLLPIEAYQSGG